MKYLTFPLQHEQAIVLQGDCSGSAADIALLARLTNTTLLENNTELPMVVWEEPGKRPPEDAACVYWTKTVKMVYNPEEQNFHLYLKDDSQLHRSIYGIFMWQLSTICAAASALLRGKNVQLVHCSMLEKDDQALLLLGESGIGKSTSVRRWQEAGNIACADDMVLLEYAEDGILVHRLPTWSACRVQLEGRLYPFDPPLKLKNVLAITRGSDHEYVGEISRAEFFAQLYRCCFFHYLPIAPNLPKKEQKMLADAIRKSTARLTDEFKPLAFFAHLDGDIAKTLGEFL